MKSYAWIALAFATVACASSPEPDSPIPAASQVGARTVSGLYVHAASGVPFPEAVGKFERVSVMHFDQAGANIGVGYNLEADDLQMLVTVYVYPAHRAEDGSSFSLSEEFEIAQQEIAKHHEIAGATAPWIPPQTQNGEPLTGHAIGFRYLQDFAGQSQPVESVLYLFEYEGWLIKYRITYPQSQAEVGNVVSQVFVSIFKWRGGA